jgi:creatinine amidohydrolase
LDIDKRPPFPVMELMTVRLVRAYLAEKKSVILPVGGIEQHGYHLPLRTDAVIAERLAWRAGERLGLLVAPAVLTTFSGGGLPGTINVTPSVMSLVVNDILVSLAGQGFRNVYLFLGHGGSENLRALNDGLRILLRSNASFEHVLIAVLPVWKLGLKDIGWRRALREKDWHAGWLETSMMLDLAPELVRMDELELDTPELLRLQRDHPDNYQRAEKIVDDPLVVPRLGQRPDIQVGVMGAPGQASREIGHEVNEDIVDDLCARISALEANADGVYRSVPHVPEPVMLADD